jgi:hypothetical protein
VARTLLSAVSTLDLWRRGTLPASARPPLPRRRVVIIHPQGGPSCSSRLVLRSGASGTMASLQQKNPSSRLQLSLLSLLLVAISCLTSAASALADKDEKHRTVLDLSEKELHRYFPELKGLKSPETQQELPSLLQKLGENASTLLRNVPNLSSKEEVLQEELHYDTGGRFRGFPLFSGKYSYLVLAHREGDGVRLVEYRTDLKGKESHPGMEGGSALTQGFALLPLHFHPFHQAATTFRYLGRQVLDHQETYVIAFAQQPERAQLTGEISMGGKVFHVAYQGIAWIEPTSFQIVRMRTDLLVPPLAAEVRGQTTEIWFSEVQVAAVPAPLWLPKEVVVTTFASGRVLRNKHRYSDYKKFVAESRIVPESELEKK